MVSVGKVKASLRKGDKFLNFFFGESNVLIIKYVNIDLDKEQIIFAMMIRNHYMKFMFP